MSINGKTVIESDDSNYKEKDYGFLITTADLITQQPPTRRPTKSPTNSAAQSVLPIQDMGPEVVVSFIMMGDGKP